MHSRSDNIEVMIKDEADDVIQKLFETLKKTYQNNFESVKDSDFVFDLCSFIVL